MDGMPEEIEKLWADGTAMLKDAGAEIRDISLPHTKYGACVLRDRPGRGVRQTSRAMTASASATAPSSIRAMASPRCTRRPARKVSVPRCSAA